MDRLEVLQAAAGLHAIQDMDESQAVREKIKAAVHEWPQDLIIETLLDAAECAVIPPNDAQGKVMAYGLAYLLNHAEALSNGMDQNLPERDGMSPNGVLITLDEMIKTHRGDFERWGLGHLIKD